MVQWYHSIITKLTVAFVILILIIAGLSVLYTFGATKSALKETTQDELVALASVIATQIDGDILAALQPGDEVTPEFITMRDQLYATQTSSPEILYLYTMKQTSDGIVFVVDAEYGISEDSSEFKSFNYTHKRLRGLFGTFGHKGDQYLFVHE